MHRVLPTLLPSAVGGWVKRSPLIQSFVHAPLAAADPIQFSPLTKRDRRRLLRIRQNFRKGDIKDQKRPRDLVSMGSVRLGDSHASSV